MVVAFILGAILGAAVIGYVIIRLINEQGPNF
jgi:uncharacterized membrane-anchored protein YhcB (DUF1043 family)